MNLTKLFDMQRKLDERIVHEKGLEGRDMLPEKILSLLVELGECANEWRGFKYWSEDREPRKFVPNPDDTCKKCNAQGMLELDKDFKDRPFCDECDGCGVHFHNPLLEEYVDCLHFILSIGLELGFHYCIRVPMLPQQNITDALLDMFELVGTLDMKGSSHDYDMIVSRFIELGEMLGFTWEEIESAYMEKNATNHSRQENGY